MHQYLKAIGFDKIENRKQLNTVLSTVLEHHTDEVIVNTRYGQVYCELKKEFGEGFGIAIFGEMSEEKVFEPSYYYPYFEGSAISTYSQVIVDSKIDKEQYVALCEDPRIGISVIFTIQNGIDYIRQAQEGFEDPFAPFAVILSAMALSGTILLPVKKDKKKLQDQQEASDNRKNLLNAARSGDQSAIETLTLDDIDAYTKVSKRLAKEDVFSIVDTYFMPYGIESDLYSIMGEILSVKSVRNEVTQAELIQMRLNVNELELDLCVPKEGLLGEPAVGRRFKGTIWLHGHINF